MRFFKDDPRTTRIRWFFTDKPFLPFSTTFASRNWEAINGQWIPELGEVQGATRRWRNGAPPGPLPPGGPCLPGDPQWVTGCLIADAIDPSELDPFGWPACCGRPVLKGAGGLKLQGFSAVVVAPPPVSQGGLRFGGAALVAPGYALTSQGGVRWDGMAATSAGVAVISQGGPLWSGLSVTGDTVALVSTGGARFDGAAGVASNTLFVGTGGVLLGGSSSLGTMDTMITQVVVEVCSSTQPLTQVTQVVVEIAYKV